MGVFSSAWWCCQLLVFRSPALVSVSRVEGVNASVFAPQDGQIDAEELQRCLSSGFPQKGEVCNVCLCIRAQSDGLCYASPQDSPRRPVAS